MKPAEILKTSEKTARKGDVRYTLVELLTILLRSGIVLVLLITTVVARIPGAGSRRRIMSGVMRNSGWGLMIEEMAVKSRRIPGRLRRLGQNQRNFVLVLQHHLITEMLFLNNDSGDVIVRLKVNHQGILKTQHCWMVQDGVRGFVFLQLRFVPRSLLPLPQLPGDCSVSSSQSLQDVLQAQQILEEVLLFWGERGL